MGDRLLPQVVVTPPESDGPHVDGSAFPDLRISARGGAICSGEPVTITAGLLGGMPPFAYAWQPEEGLSDPHAESPVATKGGTYTVTVTDGLGRVERATVQVFEGERPVASAGADSLVAANGAVRLEGSATRGAPPYAWSWSPTETLDDPQAAQPLASPRSPTAYSLTVTDSIGCSDSDAVNVALVPALVVRAQGNDLLCLDGGSSVPVSSRASGGVGTLRTVWSASPPCVGCIADPTSPTTAVSPDRTTTFTVTVSDDNGTVATDSVVVRVLPSLEVDAGPDRRVERGGVVQIGAPPMPGFHYTWTCDNWSCGLSDPNVSDPWVAPAGNTAYKVTATDGGTCTGTDVVLVSMDMRIVATVPTEGYDRWSRDALLWMVFDSDLDPSSLAGNVELWDPATGLTIAHTDSYDRASRTLELDPVDADYWNNRPYAVRLKGGSMGLRTPDSARGMLFSDFVLAYGASSMGDGRPPHAAFLHPAAAATGVSTGTQVVVQFDEPVDPRSVDRSSFRIDGVPATVTYDPRTWTATLRPSARLAPNTNYTVSVAGVQDGPQNRAAFEWSFSTGSSADAAPPRVIAADPRDGSVGIDVGAPLLVSFSEPLDSSTLAGVRLIDEETGAPVAAEVIWDERARAATVDPHRLLEPDRSYRLEVSGVADQAGNLQLGTFVARFATGPAILIERFENGAPGWTFDAPWAVDYQGALAGTRGLVDSPAGRYGANAGAAATSPAIPVAGRSSVQLGFWNQRLLGAETDALVVESSTDGRRWTAAGSLLGPSGWRFSSWSIPTGSASQLWIRLRLVSDAGIQLDGVSIDELVVR